MPEPTVNQDFEAMEGPSGGSQPEVQAGTAQNGDVQGPLIDQPLEQTAGSDDFTDDEYIDEDELEALREQEPAFSWQASEFVHHHKGPAWYMTLFGVLTALIIVAILLKLWLTIFLFIAMGAAIVVYARKPPRVLTYELTSEGITIESKTYPFSEFRSFGVLPEAEWHTIDLEPTKRFSPRISLMFNDEDFDEIVGHLELHLPREDRRPDVIEWLTRYLRF